MPVKRMFVSDIHAGAGRSLGKPNSYDWLQNNDRNQLVATLRGFQGDPSISEIIILGDLFDTWVYPIDETPPAYDEIIKGPHADLFTTIDRVTKTSGKTVTYVPGNHDMTVWEKANQDVVKKAIPKMIFSQSFATADGILAEHGHQYLAFNARDDRNDPGHGLPIGYYLARLHATAVRDGGMHHTVEFMGDVAQHLLNILIGNPARTGQQIISEAVDFLLGRTKSPKSDVTVINLEGGKSTTIGEVKAKYKDMFDNWKRDKGENILEVLHAEADGLNKTATRVVMRDKKKVVLFGHTHNECCWPVTDPASVLDPSAQTPLGIYANCGTWCGVVEDKPYTFISISSENGKHEVKAKNWTVNQKKMNI